MAVPFLDAYQRQKAANEAQPMRELQQVGAAMSLAGAIQKQEQERAFRSEVQALGPNPNPEAVMAVTTKYADPKSLMEMYQQDAHRKTQATERAMQFAENINLRQQQLDFQREQFQQRTVDQASRDRFEEFYKTETLKHRQAADALNAQLRTMGYEITKQGQQLQLAQFDATKRARDEQRLDKDTIGFSNDLQQQKLPNLSSSISSLNNLLKRYEGKGDIPGVGLMEGSKLIPGFMRSPEAANVKSAVQAVANDLLNLYSGLAVTLPEAERRELEMMSNGTFRESDFKNAWQRTVGRYNTVLGNMTAGQRKEVLEAYRSRPGAMSLDPLSPAFAGELNAAPPAPEVTGVPPPPDGFRVVSP